MKGSGKKASAKVVKSESGRKAKSSESGKKTVESGKKAAKKPAAKDSSSSLSLAMRASPANQVTHAPQHAAAVSGSPGI